MYRHSLSGVIVLGAVAIGCSGSNTTAGPSGNDEQGNANRGGAATASTAATAAGGNPNSSPIGQATGGNTNSSTNSSPIGQATGGNTNSSTNSSPIGLATGGNATTAVGGKATGGAAAGGTANSSTGDKATSTTGTGGKAMGGTSAVAGGNSSVDSAAPGGKAATGGKSGNGGAPATGGVAGANSAPSTDAVKSEGCGKSSTLKSANGLKITLTSPGSGERNYNLKLPDNYDSSHPYRLILSYHWVGGTANDVSNGGVAKPYYGLWDLAQGSAIFVAPDGTPNTIMGNTGNMWANSNGSDVEFSRQLILYLESELCIDKSRIFCEGFSMGGSMSYAMACGLGDMVRAVAVHSGGPMSGCAKHSRPVAYFMTHGTNDTTCTYPGYGVPELQDFAKTNGCTKPDPTVTKAAFQALMPTPTDSSGKTPACFDFEGCKEGYPTRACLFVGSHTPSPGGTSGWVPAESWKFLSQF
jgi:poly(3-hydroxybutyrate) depolymerase